MKMAAILRHSSRSQNIVMLRMDRAGHGFGTTLDQVIAQDADVFSFLVSELGMDQQA